MSAVTPCATGLMYFGKVPSRGDFVRSAGQSGLIASLDKWQSQSMDRLSADPRWKLIYDAAPALHFAIAGTGGQIGLAGHWMASQDASGRRFPFVTASAFELTPGADVLAVAPLALARLWARLEQVARVAHAATDLAHAQASLSGPLDVVVSAASARQLMDEFLATHTVASLSQRLAAHGSRIDLRQATLALGLLLRPAMTQGTARLGKMLCLPLVRDAAMRPAVAAWWLSLVVGFFRRQAVELGLFLTTVQERPCMLLGFQGASAAALHAAVDPALLAAQGVFLDDADWVEAEVEADYGLRKLSNYLRDPGLSLAQARDTYNEVFLGM